MANLPELSEIDDIEVNQEEKKPQTNEESTSFFQCFIDISVWWNNIPFMRHLITILNAITLILSYTCWPGIISSLYLMILMTICIIQPFINKSLTRFFSPLILILSAVHLVADIVFSVIDTKNFKNKDLLYSLGFNIDKAGTLVAIFHPIVLVIQIVIATLSSFTKSIDITRQKLKNFKLIMVLCFYFCSLMLITHKIGVNPLLLCIFSMIMYFLSKDKCYYLSFIMSIIVSFSIICHLFICIIFDFVSVLGHKGPAFELAQDIMEIIGINITPLSLTRWKISVEVLSGAIASMTVYTMTKVRENRGKKVFKGLIVLSSKSSKADKKRKDKQKKNAKEMMDALEMNQKEAHGLLKKIMRRGYLKVLIRTLFNCTLYLIYLIFYLFAISKVNIFGLYLLVFSSIYMFFSHQEAKRSWTFFIMTTLVCTSVMTIVSNIIEGTTNDGSDEFWNAINFDFSSLKIDSSSILLSYGCVFLLIFQKILNEFGNKMKNDTVIDLKVKYCCTKFVDQWYLTVSLIVLAVCIFCEKFNIMMVLYVVIFCVMLICETHTRKSKQILKYVMPVCSIVVIATLIFRYSVHFYYVICGYDKKDLEGKTIFNLYEFGLNTFFDGTTMVASYIPHIVVFIMCAVTTRLLFTIPKNLRRYRKNVIIMNLEKENKKNEHRNRENQRKDKELEEMKQKALELINKGGEDYERGCLMYDMYRLEKRKERDKRKNILQKLKTSKERAKGRDIMMHKNLQRSVEASMRFMAIYIPYICLIIIMVFVFLPLHYVKTDSDKTFDALHYVISIPILISFFSNKGFVRSIIPLSWMCTLSMLLLCVINFKGVDKLISKVGIMDDPEKKNWIYSCIGMNTCAEFSYQYDIYKDDKLVGNSCETYDGFRYPSTWQLLKDFLFIGIFSSLAKQCYYWGKRWRTDEVHQYEDEEIQKEITKNRVGNVNEEEKEEKVIEEPIYLGNEKDNKQRRGKSKDVNELIWFRYRNIQTQEGNVWSNKLKFYLSNFFSCYGIFLIYLCSIISSMLHSNDIMCLPYILFAITMMWARFNIVSIMWFFQILLSVLYLYQSITSIPLAGEAKENEGDKLIHDFSWDYQFTFWKYLLYISFNGGKTLVASNVFDMVFIFLLRCYIRQSKNGTLIDLYSIVSGNNFPRYVNSFVDRILKVLLRNINLIAEFGILLCAVNRNDIIAFIYFIVMIWFLFANSFCENKKRWQTLQTFTCITLVLQNLCTFLNLLNKYREEKYNGTTMQTVSLVLLRICQTIGFNAIAGRDFIANYLIFFILWIRSSLFDRIPGVFYDLQEIDKDEIQMNIAYTKQLIDLDTNLALIELDKEYNEKIMRKRRLEELRLDRINHKVNSVHVTQDEVSLEFFSVKYLQQNFLLQFLKVIWNEVKKAGNSLLKHLHGRNLAVRLELKKDTQFDEMKDIIDTEVRDHNQCFFERHLERQAEGLIDYEDLKKEKGKKNESEDTSSEEEVERIYDSKFQFTSVDQINRMYKMNKIDERYADSSFKYKYENKFFMFFWGIYVYLSEKTEVFVQLIFVLDFILNRNILSAVYPLVAFGFVILSKRPFPPLKFWNFMCFVNITFISLRMFFQFPGFCMKPTSDGTHDTLGYSVKDSTIVCPGTSITNNQTSFLYILGLYRIDQFILSPFIMDVLCLVAVNIHLSKMKRSGMWSKEYLLRLKKSQNVIENYRRSLVNKLEPGKTEPIPFLVRTKQNAKQTAVQSGYLDYKENHIYIVLSIQANGDLFVRRGKKVGLIPNEDVKIFDAFFETIKTKETDKSPKMYDSFDKHYSVKEPKVREEDEFDEFDFYRKEKENLEKRIEEDVFDQYFEGCNNIDAKDRKEKLTKSDLKHDHQVLMYETIMIQRNESTKTSTQIKQFFTMILRQIKKFYSSIVAKENESGSNYYMPMIISEALCFVYLVVFSPQFIKTESNFIEYFLDSFLPITYVMGLFLQFINIILDRIIYVMKSVKLKLLMQYFTLIVYHVLIFLIHPLTSGKSGVGQTICLVIYYLFKVFYWTVSALQIKSGYVVLSSNKLFMSDYSLITKILFSVYYKLPFVYEIKTILDWTFTKTTMLYEIWLKVQDIHAELFLNQCDRVSERNKKHVYGQPRTVIDKLAGGCLMGIVILTVLWFPLIFMSSAVPMFSEFKPLSMSIGMDVGGGGQFFAQEVIDFTRINASEIEAVADHYGEKDLFLKDGTDVYFKTSIPLWSLSYWTITNDNYDRMKSSFCDEKKENNVYITISMTREDSAAAGTFAYESKITLPKEGKKAVCDSMNNVKNNASIPMIPLFYMMPPLDSEELEIMGKTMLSLHPEVKINEKNGLSYWYFTTNSSVNYVINQTQRNVTDELVVYIASPQVPKDNIFTAISGLGIIGIYTGIVMVVYNLIKSNYSGVAHDIMFQQMPDCLALLQLCDDIILARQDGDLKLEEDLVDELIHIYRCPDFLVEKTYFENAVYFKK